MIQLNSAFQFCIDPETCHGQYFEFTWKVPENLPYFEGHFPGQPMLPAVAVMDANTQIIEQVLKKQVRIEKLITAKFTGPIQPGIQIQIKVEKKPDTSTWHFDWQEMSLESEGKSLAQMALAFVFETASEASK